MGLKHIMHRGLKWAVADGRVDMVGSSNFDLTGTVFSVVKFDDGSHVKTVAADAVGATNLAPGTPGKFVFVEIKKKGMFLLAHEAPDGRRYVCDGELFGKLRTGFKGQAMLYIILGIPAILLFGLGLVLIGFGLALLSKASDIPDPQNIDLYVGEVLAEA